VPEGGLKFGVYYSIGLDWHHPGGGNFGQPKWDPAQKGDPEAYMNKVAIPQVRELLNHYRLDLVWWDGGTPDVWDSTLPAHATRLYEEFKPFPKLIVNNRLYDNYRSRQLDPEYWKPVADPVERFARGDYATPECNIPHGCPRHRLGNLRDDEPLVGVQPGRQPVEIFRDSGPESLRYREQGRELPVERGADERGIDPAAFAGPVGGGRGVDEGERGGDLRDFRRALQVTALGPLHDEGFWQQDPAVPACFQLAC
jgi:hypothetical protein